MAAPRDSSAMKVHRLSPLEQVFLGCSQDTYNLPIISVILTFTPTSKIDRSFIEHNLIAKLLQIPRLRAVYNLDGSVRSVLHPPPPDHPFNLADWEARNKINPDQKRLLRTITCDPPLPESFCHNLAALSTTPLHLDYPLWEIVLVTEALVSGRAPAAPRIVLRVHHALADGISLLNILQNLLASPDQTLGLHQSPVPNAALTRRAWSTYGVLTPLVLLARLLHACWKLLVTAFIMDRTSVLAGPNISDKKSVAMFTTDFEKLRFISKTLQVTVTEVILSLAVGAARESLIQNNQASRLRYSLNMTLPFSRRRFDQTLICHNSFVPLMSRAPVDIDLPYNRLLETQKSLTCLKNSFEPMIATVMMGLLGVVPRNIRKSLYARLASHSSIIVSSVRGPQDILCLGSEVLDSICYIGVASGHAGVIFSHISYGGKLYSTLLCDLTLSQAGSNAVARAWEAEVDLLYEEAKLRAKAPKSKG